MTQTVLIGDICTRVTSGGTPSTRKAEYYDGDIPWLRTQEVKFGNIYSTEKTITEAGLKNSSAKLIPENSVIIAMYGATAGKSAINKIPVATNQACCNLIIDHNKADYRFVYYYLFNQYEKLLSAATGAAQQNLGAKQIASMSIVLPELETQKKIANVLGAIDEKIELNRKMNETLEQMGQALFRHYFITNPEAGHWEKKALGDIVDLRGGLSYKASFLTEDKSEMPMVTMGCVSAKYRINLDAVKRYTGEYKEQHILTPGDIFIATRDVTQDRVLIGSPAIIPEILGKAICATNLYKVVLKENVSTEFLYQLMRTTSYREQIVANAKGSTIVMLTKDSVLNYKFGINLSSELYEKYIQKAEAIRQAIDHNSKQIQTLTILRDTLLPRLINGKLKI